MKLKVFNLMSGITETRYLDQNKSCECKCVLKESACNLKRKWNHDECWCGCKGLDDRNPCIDDYMWNPSTCDCEYNKAWKIDQYLNIKSCSCEKCLIDKLILECEDEIINATENSFGDKKVTWKNYCLIYTISLVIKCFLL